MSKIAVIYWSGTGNTQAMAEAVAEGAKGAGAQVDLYSVSETSAGAAAAYDTLALGCPAMGAEVLEESEFEPFLPSWKAAFPAKRWRCSALTGGATGSGCAIGQTAWPPAALQHAASRLP